MIKIMTNQQVFNLVAQKLSAEFDQRMGEIEDYIPSYEMDWELREKILDLKSVCYLKPP